MAIDKIINLAPTSAETTTYETSGSVSTRAFKILRQQVDDNKNTLQAEISVNADEIALKASKTYVDTSDAALQSQITVNADAITLKASKTYVDTSDAALQSQITVNANAITLKASQTSLNTTNTNVSNLTTRVTTAEATLVVQAGQIATKVSTTDLNTTLSNYSTITQTATQIATRVATTDYNGNTIASLINQTATTIQISASKINLSGYVTVSNLTDGVTTIDGGNIRTGTINADRITAGYLTAGTIGGWSIGSSTISRSGITLGNAYIQLVGNSTSDATINLTSSNGTARIYARSTGSTPTVAIDTRLQCDGDAYIDGRTYSTGITVDDTSYTRSIYPSITNTYHLGSGTARWADIYAATGVVSTSDLREKNTIEDIKNGIELILGLSPVQFKFNDGIRTHYGLIAQELKQTMTNVGIDDAAVYVDTSVNNDGYLLGIRYEELIAPMVQTIQHLEARIKELENKAT